MKDSLIFTLPQITSALFALSVLFASSASVQSETGLDGVEVVPVYLGDARNGILRYDNPDAGRAQYTLAIGGLTGIAVRPFEVFGAVGGPLDWAACGCLH